MDIKRRLRSGDCGWGRECLGGEKDALRGRFDVRAEGGDAEGGQACAVAWRAAPEERGRGWFAGGEALGFQLAQPVDSDDHVVVVHALPAEVFAHGEVAAGDFEQDAVLGRVKAGDEGIGGGWAGQMAGDTAGGVDGCLGGGEFTGQPYVLVCPATKGGAVLVRGVRWQGVLRGREVAGGPAAGVGALLQPHERVRHRDAAAQKLLLDRCDGGGGLVLQPAGGGRMGVWADRRRGLAGSRMSSLSLC